MNFTPDLSGAFHGKLIWRTTYFLIAAAFVLVANDNTFDFLLKNPSFYTDIIFSLAVTFGTGFYLRTLNAKLDKKFPWVEMFKIRLFKQMTQGILFPLVFAMILEIIYLRAINISFLNSAMLNFELPLAIIFLILLNLISLTGYLFKHRQKEAIVITEQVIASAPKRLEYINVQKGFVEARIELDKCALIMSASKLLWLHTFEGEKYRLPGTLEEWEEKLKHANFYRINRQYLSSYKAIQSVEQTDTRKLKVHFTIPTGEVYISKTNVASFRQWWKQ